MAINLDFRRCNNKGLCLSGQSVGYKQFPWVSCAPFVDNSRGTLIHRPRSASTYNLYSKGPHIGIQFWCGMSVSSDGKNITLLSSPLLGVFL